MDFKHITVLRDQSIDALCIKQNGIYADMTLGGGGHSEEILKRGGRVIGIDRDSEAIDAARLRLADFGDRFTAVKSNFKDIKKVMSDLSVDALDGVIMDLGVSSHQLDEADRGFSYMQDARLDMRMDKQQSFSAYEIINGYEKSELKRVISDYGEERWADRIAEFIINERQTKSIETTLELVEIIKKAIPKAARREGGHPAKRTFQAIRIEVNDELKILERSAEDATELLKVGGRIAIITFHSLEDRIIKQLFTRLKRGCTCPKDFPVCVCGGKQKVKIIGSKPIVPSNDELEQNSRAKSAKLRVAERV